MKTLLLNPKLVFKKMFTADTEKTANLPKESVVGKSRLIGMFGKEKIKGVINGCQNVSYEFAIPAYMGYSDESWILFA